MALSKETMQKSNTCMILVMGVTGSGKSHFINTLVEGATKEYPGLYSGLCHSDTYCKKQLFSNEMSAGTKICQMVQTKIGEDTSVAIVDTPGFDDTTRTDAEILALITKFLTSQYQLGIPLKGIIYLHRITDQKMQGSALRNFQMFQKICGDQALKNVVLLTTMWDKLKDEMEGLDRDQELRENFWSLMEEKGSYIARFDGSPEMAESMIAMLLAKDSIVLNIQKELQDKGKRLDQTSAGRLLVDGVEAELDSKQRHIRYLEAQIQDSKKDKKQREKLEQQKRDWEHRRRQEERERDRLRAKVAQDTDTEIKRKRGGFTLKDGLQVFAALTGVAATVIFNLLPLFGVNL